MWWRETVSKRNFLVRETECLHWLSPFLFPLLPYFTPTSPPPPSLPSSPPHLTSFLPFPICHRPFMFRPQSKDMYENGGYQTAGVEMVVTAERVILLDSQPILSDTLYDQLCTNPTSVPHDMSPSIYLELMVSVPPAPLCFSCPFSSLVISMYLLRSCFVADQRLNFFSGIYLVD